VLEDVTSEAGSEHAQSTRNMIFKSLILMEDADGFSYNTYFPEPVHCVYMPITRIASHRHLEHSSPRSLCSDKFPVNEHCNVQANSAAAMPRHYANFYLQCATTFDFLQRLHSKASPQVSFTCVRI
jgi:hypothetical protein